MPPQVKSATRIFRAGPQDHRSAPCDTGVGNEPGHDNDERRSERKGRRANRQQPKADREDAVREDEPPPRGSPADRSGNRHLIEAEERREQTNGE